MQYVSRQYQQSHTGSGFIFCLFFGFVFASMYSFAVFECFLGGVPPQENLHSNEPGVGWEAFGGLINAGRHRAGRGHVRMELPGAHGQRPVAEGYQR